MKVRFHILSFCMIAAFAILAACETERIIFDGPYFIRFTQESEVYRESHGTLIRVQINNAGPAPKGDLKIAYAISGSAREGIDYVINGTRGTTRIRNGEYFGYIDIQLLNNANNIIRTQDIILTLLTNDGDLQVGQGKGQIGRIYTLTIQDDCILGGEYSGVRDNNAPVEGITISSADCTEYTLSNWDITIFGFEENGFPSIRALTFIDKGDNTITIPPQKDPTLFDGEDTIDGRGVVNPQTRVITLTVRLVDFEGQPEYTFDLIPD